VNDEELVRVMVLEAIDPVAVTLTVPGGPPALALAMIRKTMVLRLVAVAMVATRVGEALTEPLGGVMVSE